MSIRRGFDDVYSLFERMDNGMAVDVAEEGDAFVVTADLPGVTQEDVTVRIRGQTLSIEAVTESTTESRSGDAETGSYLRRERSSRSMGRSIELPARVDADGASAELVNGVLTVTVPKAETETDGTAIDVQ